MIRAFIVLAALGLGGVGCEGKPTTPALKPAPKVTSVVPEVVTPLGYRLGQINGEGFDTKVPVKVVFGATPAKRAAVVAKNMITVEIPPGTNGTAVDVRVELQGYEPAMAPAKMRYDEGDHGEAARKELEEAADHADGSAHDDAEDNADGSAHDEAAESQ